MIKFFRKIRQNLLSDNKFSKPASPAGRYLIYAIGEIVLVVVGILIALQINNWNEKRINNIEEKSILNALRMEISENQFILAKDLKRHANALRLVNFFTGHSIKVFKLLDAKTDKKKLAAELYGQGISMRDISRVFYGNEDHRGTISKWINASKKK